MYQMYKELFIKAKTKPTIAKQTKAKEQTRYSLTWDWLNKLQNNTQSLKNTPISTGERWRVIPKS